MTTLTYTGSLTILTCWCGIKHAVPEDLRSHQMRQFNDGKPPIGIYCPLGHSHMPAGETQAQKLQRNLDWARDDAARERARADGAEASRRAWKGQATRARNKVIEGTCPFCGKYLVDLDLHVTRKHPDEHVGEHPEPA